MCFHDPSQAGSLSVGCFPPVTPSVLRQGREQPTPLGPVQENPRLADHISRLVRLLSQVFFYTLIGVLVADEDFTRYIVIGAALATCIAETMLATASTCWDRYQGTIETLVSSPIAPGPFFFGRSLQWPLSAMATTSIALLVVPPFFNVYWSLWQIPVLIGIVVLTCLSTHCMTLLIASLTLVYDQARNVTGTMTTLSTTAVCGAMVPVDFWPEPVQWIAQALPITHGLSAVRARARSSQGSGHHLGRA